MSELGLHYIAGILQHAPALAAFTNPGTNSYRRLVPGFEAPINLAYSSRNRSAAVRIPMYSPSPKAKRIEVRFPDPTCNPYQAFSVMLMVGLDGIQRWLDLGQPLDKDIYALAPAELADVLRCVIATCSSKDLAGGAATNQATERGRHRMGIILATELPGIIRCRQTYVLCHAESHQKQFDDLLKHAQEGLPG